MRLRKKLREAVGLRPKSDNQASNNISLSAKQSNTSFPIRTTSSTDNSAFNEALVQHLQKLSPSEKSLYQNAYHDITPESLLEKVQQYDAEHIEDSRFRQRAKPVAKVLGVIEQFMQGVAIGIQSNPEISSLVVGAVRVVIDIAVKFVTFFNRLVDMIVRLSDHLGHLKEYAESARKSDLIQKALANVYGDLLDFCRKARLVFLDEQGSKRRWVSMRQFWSVQWRPFEDRFGTIDLGFQRHLQVLHHSAQALQLNSIQTGNYEANEERLRVLENERTNERKDCLHWVSKHDFEADQETIYLKRHQKSGSWFIQTDEFQRWSDSQTSSLLWCFGKPGAGKSVLASIAVEHLTVQHVSTKRAAIVFAYIKYDLTETQQPSAIISSLVKQISWTETPLPACLLDFYHAYDKDARTPSLKGYEDLFLHLAESYDKIFMVFDALDECEADQRDKILDFIFNTAHTLRCVKILVTSRRENDIEKAFSRQTTPIIEIKAKNVAEDIKHFVTERVEYLINCKKLEVHDSQLESHVIETLVTRAEGMFLWVELQLSSLCQQRNRHNIEKELDLLPRGLEGTYDRILKWIDQQVESRRILAQRSLMWVMYSERSLSLKDLSVAVAIDKSCKTWEDLHEKRHPGEAILESCGNLLVVENDYVRVAHYSFHEYFKNPPASKLDVGYDPSKYLVSSQFAQAQLAESCMRCIMLYPENDLDIRSRRHDLKYYAFRYFDLHLQKLGEVTKDIQEQLRQMLNIDGKVIKKIVNLRIGNQLYVDPDQVSDRSGGLIYSTALYDLPWLGEMTEELEIPLYALHYASVSGSTRAVKRLVERGKDVNQLDSGDNTPLLYAAKNGRHSVINQLLELGVDLELRGLGNESALYAAAEHDYESVKLLVEAGADVNAQGGFYGNALQAAAAGGKYEIVKLLIEEGADINAQGLSSQFSTQEEKHERMKLLVKAKADVNAQGGGYSNALQAAIVQGNYEKVKLLVEAKTDVKAQRGRFANALHTAIVKGEYEIIKLLIEAKADVNDPRGGHCNALQAAIVHGNYENVKLLVEAGADVNAQGGINDNALQVAVLGGKYEIMKLLVEAKVDVNAQAGEYGNALQTAIVRGNYENVKLLVEAGADVNAQGKDYDNALQAATLEKKYEIMKLLFEAKADVNAQGSKFGNTLHAATCIQDYESVKLLVEAGADVNAQGGYYGNALQAAVFGGKYEIMKLLVEAKADVNAQRGEYGNALQAAVVRENYENVKLLLDAGADVNAQGGKYGNALQAAALSENYQLVQLLLEEKANVHAIGGKYGHALVAASRWGCLDNTGLFIEAGADVNVGGGSRGSPLSTASRHGHFDVVEELLKAGADVNARRMGRSTALHCARRNGHEKVAQLLVQRDAVDEVGEDGDTDGDSSDYSNDNDDDNDDGDESEGEDMKNNETEIENKNEHVHESELGNEDECSSDTSLEKQGD